MEKDEAEQIVEELEELSANGPHDRRGRLGMIDARVVETEHQSWVGDEPYTTYHVEVEGYAKYYDEGTPSYKDPPPEGDWSVKVPYILMDYVVRRGLGLTIKPYRSQLVDRPLFELNEASSNIEDQRELVDGITWEPRAAD